MIGTGPVWAPGIPAIGSPGEIIVFKYFTRDKNIV